VMSWARIVAQTFQFAKGVLICPAFLGQ
jgi:hypothetical protein